MKSSKRDKNSSGSRIISREEKTTAANEELSGACHEGLPSNLLSLPLTTIMEDMINDAEVYIVIISLRPICKVLPFRRPVGSAITMTDGMAVNWTYMYKRA